MRNVCLAVILTAFATTAGYAAEPLSGDQIKQLLSGNTAYGEHAKKAFEIIRYFAADGKLVQYRASRAKKPYSEGKWSVDGSKLCMGLGRHGQTCGKLVKSGEHYLFLKEHDKHIFTFKKIASGNPEKL